MSAYSFVGNVARTALDAIVDGDLADGAERFVVKGRNTKSGAQFFIELAEILQVRGESGQLDAIVGKQEFLVAGVPQSRELSFDHDRGQDSKLITRVSALAKLGAAAVFFDADDAARAADGKAKSGQTLDGLGVKTLFDIPHDALRLKKAVASVKRAEGKRIFECFSCMLREFKKSVAQEMHDETLSFVADSDCFHRRSD